MRDSHFLVHMRGQRQRFRADLHLRGSQRIRRLQWMAALHAASAAGAMSDLNIEAPHESLSHDVFLELGLSFIVDRWRATALRLRGQRYINPSRPPAPEPAGWRAFRNRTHSSVQEFGASSFSASLWRMARLDASRIAMLPQALCAIARSRLARSSVDCEVFQPLGLALLLWQARWTGSHSSRIKVTKLAGFVHFLVKNLRFHPGVQRGKQIPSE